MAEFAAAEVPDEGKGPAAGGGGAAGAGGAEENSYPMTVVYCGGEGASRASSAAAVRCGVRRRVRGLGASFQASPRPRAPSLPTAVNDNVFFLAHCCCRGEELELECSGLVSDAWEFVLREGWVWWTFRSSSKRREEREEAAFVATASAYPTFLMSAVAVPRAHRVHQRQYNQPIHVLTKVRDSGKHAVNDVSVYPVFLELPRTFVCFWCWFSTSTVHAQ